MISREVFEEARRKALAMLDNAGIALTAAERENVEVADFGLGELDTTGLELIVYLNTERCCAKELVLFPGQTCPEHRHPTVEDGPGKEETFRCRAGRIYLYVEGGAAANPQASPPDSPPGAYTVFHEVILSPGEQYTLRPDTLHWFQAGPEGAIVSEFSTKSRDEADVFADPRIQRTAIVED